MKRTTSVRTRLISLLLVCFVPLTIMLISLLAMVNRVSSRYDQIVENIVSVNNYNMTFKEELDYTMYIIAVNSGRAAELVDLEQPHKLIGDARETFQKLQEKELQSESRREILMILQNLDKLETHVNEMEQDAQIVGMYDKNMYRLEMDVRILTELIQEGIQNYIDFEVQNLEELRLGIRRDVKNTVAFGAMLVIGILAIALYSSNKTMKRITDGIGRLQHVTEKAGSGEFDVRADMKDSDTELAELGDGFDRMVGQLGNLVEDIRTEQRNLRIMEQKLLQAQINPHFLYNTLDAIIWLAEAGEDKQVIMMVSALSDFFRNTLSKGRDIITVEEEKSHIQSYLQIQQFRYQDILDYEIEIPQSLYHYQMKKLMLQPLVENALYHGIKNKRGMGRINVRGWEADGKLWFEVRDNGIGMTEERLDMVRKEIYREPDVREELTSFGLYNVVQRIRLNYGDEYGLTIESTYGEGTVVQVCIPALTQVFENS